MNFWEPNFHRKLLLKIVENEGAKNLKELLEDEGSYISEHLRSNLLFGKSIDNKKIKTSLDFESMVKLRLVRKNELVKMLGRGDLKGKIKISAHKFTASAKSAIEAAGGEAVNI